MSYCIYDTTMCRGKAVKITGSGVKDEHEGSGVPDRFKLRTDGLRCQWINCVVTSRLGFIHVTV